MRLYHVNHSGANRKYHLAVLDYINAHPEYDVSVTVEPMGRFLEDGVPKGIDVLSYQTFPDEHNKKKFNPAVIYKADSQFHTFSGNKLLVDLHDCGDIDSFSRIYKSKEIPRVKCFPTQWFVDNYNVVLLSAPSANPGVFPDEYPRIVTISCKFGEKVDGFYGHKIREGVKDHLLKNFATETHFNWVTPKSKYFKELRWTKIVIGAPGWGRHNASHWGAMKAGAMLFAHRSLNDIKLFPHSTLIDENDFVSYDLFNFSMKLERILHDDKEIERIRNNGRRKFEKGLNYKKSADKLVKFLRRMK